MSEGAELPSLCEALLRRRFGQARVTASTLLKSWERSRVLRLELESGPAPTLVVKQILASPHLGFSDYASHQFLSSFELPIAARFVTGDPRSRLFLMEDLGELHNLMRLLPEGDEGAIERALGRMGATMAALVSATLDGERRWNRIRSALPASPGPNRYDEAMRWREGWQKVRAWLERIDVDAPPRLEALLAELERNYAEPPVLAFSQGDPAPTNHDFSGGRCRLVDFEYGAYRHALHDLAQWQIRCPLKEAWFETLCNAVRAQLTGAVFSDRDAFDRQLAMQTAFAAIYMYMWIPAAKALEGDFPRVGSWTQRDALVCTSRRLAALAPEIAVLEPARALGRAILDRLMRLWPRHGDGEIQWRT